MVETGQQLWAPTPGRIERARITDFLRWLEANRGLTFPDFESLWRWSTDDLDGFWQACWDFFGVEATKQPTAVLGKRTMPGAQWFPGAELNYARHMLRHERPDAVAVLHLNERQGIAVRFLGRARPARCESWRRSCASWASSAAIASPPT